MDRTDPTSDKGENKRARQNIYPLVIIGGAEGDRTPHLVTASLTKKLNCDKNP
jgi:hypothetical protein